MVLAHAFVAGGEPSESERDISVGGVSRVPTGVFDGVDYVALGHLHGAQVLSDRVRYSGSPLAYSFSEHAQTKGSWLVDLAADGAVTRDVRRGAGAAAAGAAAWHARRPARRPRPGAVRACWVQATLTDAVRPPQPMERLRRRFPHTLVLAFEPDERDEPPPCRPRGPGVRSDHAIALDFVRELRGRARHRGRVRAPPGRLRRLLRRHRRRHPAVRPRAVAG